MIVGAAQIDILIGDKSSNLEKCLRCLEEAHRQGIELLVFPECTLSGYVFERFEEACQVSESIPGKSTELLERASRKYHIMTVVGLLEREGQSLYNTVVLIGPNGLVGKYRKTHLLVLGVDRLVQPGNDLSTFPIQGGKAGMLICYDTRLPEPARVLALKGAQVIFNPANLPQNAEAYPNFFNRARACENRVYFISANRVGTERGVFFIGRSQIVEYTGNILAESDGVNEGLIKAEINLTKASVKHVVNIPGEYEFDLFKDRRPQLYNSLVAVHGQ